jgi:protein-disulfide isomerase
MKQLIAAFVALFLSTLPLHAEGLTDMSETERDAFRAEVRAYLLDNPEVLMEAIGILEQRQQANKAESEQALLSAYGDDIFDDGYSWVGGNPDGDVTLVEFLDYRCGYCRKAHDEITELVASDGNIRLVVKEFPILGEQSVLSSRLAIATLHKAGPQAYADLAEFLIRFNGDLNASNMAAVLGKIGADSEAILAYMDSDAVSGQIGAVHALAGKLQISGTPTFVLTSGLIRGYVPLDGMRSIISETRAAKN